MGKRSGKRANAPAKIKDLRARTRARRASQVKGGAQVAAISDGTSNTLRTLTSRSTSRAGGAS